MVTKEIEKIREDFQAYNDRLRDKATVEETQQIWDNFNKFAFYEDLKDLYNRTFPELARFEERLIKFNSHLEKNDIILRRFDEVISEKSSKVDLKELEKLVKTSYTPLDKFNDENEVLNDRISSLSDKNREIEKSIDMMGKNISKDIYSAVRKATANMKAQNNTGGGDNIAEFGPEGNRNTDDLKSILLTKADKFELETLSLLKANKCDTELSFKWLDLMHK